jgi:hypothetical protein
MTRKLFPAHMGEGIMGHFMNVVFSNRIRSVCR